MSSADQPDQPDQKNPPDSDLQKYHPAHFCTTFPAKRQRSSQRKVGEGGGRSQAGWKRSAWAVTQKNALVHLNELRPGLRYEVRRRSGPLHAPVFAVGVDVNGLHFEGRGATVKQAKLRAAEVALGSFIQLPNASQALASRGSLSSTFTDFTADREAEFQDWEEPVWKEAGRQEWEGAVWEEAGHQGPVWEEAGHQEWEGPVWKEDEQLLRLQRGGPHSPVVLLNQLLPGLRFTCLVDRVPRTPSRRFVMALTVGGRVFEGWGGSKRAAKAQAAAAALEAVYSIGLGPPRRSLAHHGNSSKNQLPQVGRPVFQSE